MSGAGWGWLVAGVLAGELHARALWEATRRHVGPAYAPLRLLGVVGLLAVAIRSGGLTAVAGWGLGFLGGVLWRLRPRGSKP
ncbi:hypothetical protein [Cystobacter fuscus]|uniref:hypothetical protein n=1 Tax=Cystobacter fuscus TaxID=43 RepID=UPI0037BE96FE